MANFKMHTKNSAPDAAKGLMETTEKVMGVIPNMHKILAEAPVTYEAYTSLFSSFSKKTILTPIEQQVVFMTCNVENDCEYCVPVHTAMMKKVGMSDEVIAALRDNTPLPSDKLQALREYTKALLDKRGHIGDQALDKFLAAGYSERQALEVLTGIAAKIISNFTNALAHTELERQFLKHKWVHPEHRKDE